MLNLRLEVIDFNETPANQSTATVDKPLVMPRESEFIHHVCADFLSRAGMLARPVTEGATRAG